MLRTFLIVVLLASVSATTSWLSADEPSASEPASPATTRGLTEDEGVTDANSPVATEKHRYTGRVIRLSDALERRGIKAGPEMDAHMVLELENNRLLPILGDWRGKAFYQDERLRNRKVTLVANRRSDLGYLQPLMVFTYDDEGAPLFTDYWCDICSIPMYEIKPCECCQGDIRLRFTPQAPPDDVDTWEDATGKPPVNAGARPD